MHIIVILLDFHFLIYFAAITNPLLILFCIYQGNVRAANLEQNGDTHVLLVTGMTCANCASKIERTIGALSGVEKVTVSVTENRVVIQMGTSAQRTTGIRTILESVHECGFGVSDLFKVWIKSICMHH